MTRPVDKDYEYFKTIPWCARLLSDSKYSLITNTSRNPKETTEDTFIAKTLKTQETIPHWLTLYRLPEAEADQAHGAINRIPEVLTLLDVGNGVNGHPDICHGGFVATIIDEAFGFLITANQRREWERARQAGENPERKSTMTAYLNTTYKRPVATPAVLLARARIDRFEGRKRFVVGTIEDGEGNVLTIGEALFVEIPNIRVRI